MPNACTRGSAARPRLDHRPDRALYLNLSPLDNAFRSRSNSEEVHLVNAAPDGLGLGLRLEPGRDNAVGKNLGHFVIISQGSADWWACSCRAG
jgi:hypothetical protein